MPESEITHIRINSQLVGIMGLQHIMEEMAKEYAQGSDSEVQTELVRRISKKNYIPGHAKEDYGKALLQEFNKFLGRPYADDASEGLEIKVLGPGCARCNQLEREVMEVLAEMSLSADLQHVRDVKEIAQFGVMGTPALVINGKVVSVGTIPNKAKMREWLSEYR